MSSVKWQHKHPEHVKPGAVRWGWKGFKFGKGRLYTGSRHCKVEPGKWHKSSIGFLIYGWRRCDGWRDTPKKYPKGFHIHTTEQAAAKWGIPIRVKFRGVVTKGKQNGKAVVVARQMFVPKAWARERADAAIKAFIKATKRQR